MSVSLDGFHADEVEPNTGFDPIPNGEYLAIAVDSEMKPTKNNDGRYLQFTHEIIDGQFRGRRIWDRMNLENKNDTAKKIAEGTLSAFCRAVGVLRPKDSAELHNKPVKIKVVNEERNDKKGSYTNKVTGYSPANAPGAAPVQGTLPVSQPAAAAATPPWKRKSA